MALAPLASAADLANVGFDLDGSDAQFVDTMLAVASSTVRAAAGVPISETTSTVTVVGDAGLWLYLPGPPVQSVDDVTIDGDVDTDWRLAGVGLWRRGGWATDDGPCPIVVTYTHGLPEVPAHVKDLVCHLAAAGINAASAGGYGSNAGKVAEKIDDYSVTYAQGAEAVATVMELPPGTRRWLRSQFGGGAGAVRFQ